MSRRPSVTVVVPAYDASRTIDDCVRSLLALAYPGDALELLVVDNGSSDDTVDAVGRHGDRVVVIHEGRRGAAAARNAGVAAARGEIVAFTDADCVVDPHWLERLVGPLEDPGVGIAGGTILARRPANEVERFGEEIHDHRKAIEVYEPPYAITMSWASPRAVIRQAGGFDTSFRRGQDTDLAYRIVQAGYRLAFVPEAIVYHHNESTLRGLFREGFVHGFHGVHARKRHQAFLRQFGHRRGSRGVYSHIATRLLDSARGPERARSRCDAVFTCGKQAGRLAGSIRFGHLDL